MNVEKRIKRLESMIPKGKKGYITYKYPLGDDSDEYTKQAMQEYIDGGGNADCVEFIIGFADYSGRSKTVTSVNFVPIIC
jgi:hypothetical protein